MTALTTLPFFTVPSGEDSFTAAVTTSPKPAFLPEAPPRGRITCNLRAPELSATASIVLICTAIALLLLPKTYSRPALTLIGDCAGLTSGDLDGRGGCVFYLVQRRTPNDLFKRPTLQLAQRTGLADANHVADAG